MLSFMIKFHFHFIFRASGGYGSSSGGGGIFGSNGDSVILVNLEEHFGIIAGVVCGSLGLLLTIFVFLIVRRYNQVSGTQ